MIVEVVIRNNVGVPGVDGHDGLSAYEIAVLNGFTGNPQQWITSLKGANGKSAYEAYQEGGGDRGITEVQFNSILQTIPSKASSSIGAQHATSEEVIRMHVTHQKVEEWNGILSTLRDGVATEGDTLKKLYQALQTLTSVVSSDDVNLDTVREIVAFIKNNKDVIDTISTSKVSISDIVDDLLSTATNRPLSANQGKVLKGIVDSLANSQVIATKSILLSVCFSDAQEANISFPAAATIKKISWDVSAFTSVQAGVGTVSAAANGNAISIAVAAGSALNLKVAFASGKTIGSLLLEGNYN
jgi:hypothetical protein